MIPKKIHYCWFGGKALPEDTVRYIGSWRRHCPDYEIKEWNESNFDLDMFPYVREAYDAGKYAFPGCMRSLRKGACIWTPMWRC